MNLNLSAIGKFIQDGRKHYEMTQAELAEQIDISTNAVAKLENELMAPSLQTLINIANVLHMDMDQLLLAAPDNSSEDRLDRALVTRIQGLEPRDKEFLLHILEGLEHYHSSNEKKP